MRVGSDTVVGIVYAVRGKIADQVVVPESIGINRLAADAELRRRTAQRRRADPLLQRPSRLRTTGSARRADRIGRRQKSIAIPAASLLQVRESSPRINRRRRTCRARNSGLDGDRHRSSGGSSTVIPSLNDSIVVSRIQVQVSVQRRTIRGKCQDIRSAIDSHASNALGTRGRGRGSELNRGAHHAVVGRSRYLHAHLLGRRGTVRSVKTVLKAASATHKCGCNKNRDT